MGIEVLSGTPVKDLAQKDVVYLSDRLARKMFDTENPIGKVISYSKEIELTVKGTYADIPENATVRPEADDFSAVDMEPQMGKLLMERRRQLAGVHPFSSRSR